MSSYLNWRKELNAKWREKYTDKVQHFVDQLDFIGTDNLDFFIDDHEKSQSLNSKNIQLRDMSYQKSHIVYAFPVQNCTKTNLNEFKSLLETLLYKEKWFIL